MQNINFIMEFLAKQNFIIIIQLRITHNTTVQ